MGRGGCLCSGSGVPGVECQSPRTPEEEIQAADSEKLSETLADTPLAGSPLCGVRAKAGEGRIQAGGGQRQWLTGCMEGTGQRETHKGQRGADFVAKEASLGRSKMEAVLVGIG